MSKTRDTGNIGNVVRVDTNGNVSFVSGSTTLMSVSSSGAVTTTGVISGSNALSASFSLNSALLNSTGSVGFATTGALLEVSSSQQQISASYISLSGSYNTFSGSASTRITANSSSIQQVSSSLLQVSASYISLSGSYNTFSGSASTRTTQIENVYATTGSNSFRANQSITGSLVVSSTITAQTLIVQTVTSSIVYSSGSNIFGSALTDRQTFTGSVLITGSLTIAGGGNVSAPTIFGSTIACSPIGCFATSCATSFIGGTMSGTTIYGSTAVCSPVGKFTSCIDAGSGTFSSSITAASGTTITSANAQTTLNLNNTNACATIASAIYFNKNGAPKWGIGTDVYSNTGANEIQIYDFTNDLIRAKFTTSGANIIGTLGVTCAATFSSTITGTTIYGSTAVCAPTIQSANVCTDGSYASRVVAYGSNVGMFVNSTGAGEGFYRILNGACSIGALSATGWYKGSAEQNMGIITGPSKSFQIATNDCANSRLTIGADGVSVFACQVCAKSLYFSSNATGQITFGSNDACNPYIVSDSSNNLYFGSNNGYKILIPQDGGDMVFRTSPTYANPQTRLTIASTGIACFACQVCAPIVARCATKWQLNGSVEGGNNACALVINIDNSRAVRVRAIVTGVSGQTMTSLGMYEAIVYRLGGGAGNESKRFAVLVDCNASPGNSQGIKMDVVGDTLYIQNKTSMSYAQSISAWAEIFYS